MMTSVRHRDPTHTHRHTIAGQTGTTQDPSARTLVGWIVKQAKACPPPTGAVLQRRGQGGDILTAGRRLQSASGSVAQPEACSRQAPEPD